MQIQSSLQSNRHPLVLVQSLETLSTHVKYLSWHEAHTHIAQ
jgi:hypothetical protein